MFCADLDTVKSPCLYYLGSGKPGFCRHNNHFRCIEYLMKKEPILSYSYLHTYKSCKYEFLLKWLLGYQSLDISVPATTSGVFHNFMAFYYSDDAKWYAKGEQKLLDLRSKFESDRLPNEIKLVRGIADAYYEIATIKNPSEISNIIKNGKVEASKTEFKDGYSLKTIMDARIDDHGYEWKYVKNPLLYNHWINRLQLSCYFLGNPDLQQLTIRAIQKPQIRQGKNETEEEYVERAVRNFKRTPGKFIKNTKYYRSEFDLVKLEQEIMVISEEIKENIKKDYIGSWWQNQNCCYFNGYRDWPCDFLKCCEAEIHPGKLERFYKKINLEEKIDNGG